LVDIYKTTTNSLLHFQKYAFWILLLAIYYTLKDPPYKTFTYLTTNQSTTMATTTSLETLQNSVLAILSLKAWVRRHTKKNEAKKQVRVVAVADVHPEGEEAVIETVEEANPELSQLVVTAQTAQARRRKKRS
jgi:hypothetical protein